MVRFSRYKRLWIRALTGPLLGSIGNLLSTMNVNINKVDMSNSSFDEKLAKETIAIELMIRIPKGLSSDILLKSVPASRYFGSELEGPFIE